MMLGQEIWTAPASFKEQEVMNMSERWNEENMQEAEKSEETWNEDWQLPEGSGVILGEDWQKAEGEKGHKEEISDEQVDLVIGGLARTSSKSRSRTRSKGKKDDIFLPEI